MTDEEIRRLEQVWMVLVDLFEDLTRKAIHVDVASKLRNYKALLHFVRTETARSYSKKTFMIEDSLHSLRLNLSEIKRDLFLAARKLDPVYAEDWAGKVDRAERVELDRRMIYGGSKFVPGVQRSPPGCWVRLTMPKPVDEERLRQIAVRHGVDAELQNRHHVIVRGERGSIKKMVQDIYISLTKSAVE